jgi:putative cell wall-binding protein
LDEIRRLGAAEVVVVGRPDQLPSGMETTLGELGAKVRWLSAPDVYTLSAVVAAEIAAQGGGVGEVLIARGEAPDPSQVWPDALSASALAAHQRAPILLTPTDRLAPTVAQALSRLRPAHIRIVGGEAAVGPAVAAEARTVAGASSVERLSGPNRFATSVAVADAGIRAGLTGTGAWVATGRAFPDALVAGPAAARAGMPLLLLDGVSSTGAPEARSFLEGRRASLRSIVVLGGEAAVTGPVSESLRSLAGLPG